VTNAYVIFNNELDSGTLYEGGVDVDNRTQADARYIQLTDNWSTVSNNAMGAVQTSDNWSTVSNNAMGAVQTSDNWSTVSNNAMGAVQTSDNWSTVSNNAMSAIQSADLGSAAYSNATDFAAVITNTYTVTIPESSKLRTFVPTNQYIKVSCPRTGYLFSTIDSAIAELGNGSTWYGVKYTATNQRSTWSIPSTADRVEIRLYFEQASMGATNGANVQVGWYSVGDDGSTTYGGLGNNYVSSTSKWHTITKTYNAGARDDNSLAHSCLIYSSSSYQAPVTTHGDFWVSDVMAYVPVGDTATTLGTFLKDAGAD
jgi:hypothetical protein